MTREEIKYASKDYVNYLLDKQEYHNENYTEYDIRQAFEKGAMLAYNNPDLSSLWHDASEEPNKGRLMLGIEGDDVAIYKWVGQDPQGWIPFTKDMCLSKWAYIADLLPKGGDK